jgi:hypothetical protein
MRLAQHAREALVAALIDAFDRDTLPELTRPVLDLRPDEVFHEGRTLPGMVEDLIARAEQEDKVPLLVLEALKSRPEHEDLRALVRDELRNALAAKPPAESVVLLSDVPQRQPHRPPQVIQLPYEPDRPRPSVAPVAWGALIAAVLLAGAGGVGYAIGRSGQQSGTPAGSGKETPRGETSADSAKPTPPPVSEGRILDEALRGVKSRPYADLVPKWPELPQHLPAVSGADPGQKLGSRILQLGPLGGHVPSTQVEVLFGADCAMVAKVFQRKAASTDFTPSPGMARGNPLTFTFPACESGDEVFLLVSLHEPARPLFNKDTSISNDRWQRLFLLRRFP